MCRPKIQLKSEHVDSIGEIGRISLQSSCQHNFFQIVFNSLALYLLHISCTSLLSAVFPQGLKNGHHLAVEQKQS